MNKPNLSYIILEYHENVWKKNFDYTALFFVFSVGMPLPEKKGNDNRSVSFDQN